MFIMKELNAKNGTFTGNVTFNYVKEEEGEEANLNKNVTINDIISDLNILKKENEEMKEIINILWNAPPSGGPGYQEAIESWNDSIKNDI